MKITYIKEGYFKNIDDMRANAQKSNSLSKEERVNNLKAEARKFTQDVASALRLLTLPSFERELLF